MKKLKKILNAIKMTIVVILQLLAGTVMLASILLFAVAALVESPKKFAFKAQVVKEAIKKIFKDSKVERLNKKYNNEKE